jgi:hypothetical protein
MRLGICRGESYLQNALITQADPGPKTAQHYGTHTPVAAKDTPAQVFVRYFPLQHAERLGT